MKIKPLSAICDYCGLQLYPPKVRQIDAGPVAEHLAKCDVCGIRRPTKSLQDYFFILTDKHHYFD